MRIDLSNEVSLNGLQRGNKAQKTTSGKAAAGHNVEDRTDLSLDTLSIASLRAEALSAPEVRQDKVDALRLAIRNGHYKVAPDEVAQRILEEHTK